MHALYSISLDMVNGTEVLLDMTLDHLLAILEILLLVWIIVQGEIIVRCERGVYRLHKEREDERKQWREEKREQTRRKTEQKIKDSNPSLESPSPTESSEPKTKSISAPAAPGLSKNTDHPTSIISISMLRRFAILILLLWVSMVGRLKDLMKHVR